MKKFLTIRTLYYLAWIITLAAFLGSLYFSQVRHIQPCVLCWYQRICLYPLVVIMAVGIFRHDKNLPYYVLPLSVIGSLIALYQWFLQLGIVSEATAPCVIGVPCSDKTINYFGFLTIPLMALVAFVLITIAMLWALNIYRHPPKK